ncbi:MAG: transposase [Candidatus Muproteobacteria bacterium RIFCSPHIGHO2_02_FULL_60_13]|nr:MAG: transposase [Candidatus Muproteobacteria bacterium RIFCSPHIGHO2_02_FULL_60_13]
MTTNTQNQAPTKAAVPPSLHAVAGHASNTPLTRVALAYVDKRINLYLRFGNPARTIQLDRWRRSAVFLPASIFCRIRWESNDYGTTRWQLMVMQACTPLDAVQRIPGIQPGARILLHAEGERQVQAVLPLIDAIEVLGIAPIDISPAYWRTLGNRLSAHLPLPAYTAERHAAWLAGRELQ